MNAIPDTENIHSDGIELSLLSAINDASEPLGAVALSFNLEDEVGVSQATIGRKLKAFDMRGLTERVRYRGRVLTPAGEAYLRELTDTVVMARRSATFLHTLTTSAGDQLLRVMEARRGLEREIVRLATLRIGPGDVKELEELVEDQRKAIETGEPGTNENSAFHDALGRLACNEVLAHALHLVRGQSKLLLLVGTIRERVGGVLVRDHEDVVQAMREGDANKAAKAMTDHIDRLMNDIRKYLENEDDPG